MEAGVRHTSEKGRRLEAGVAVVPGVSVGAGVGDAEG